MTLEKQINIMKKEAYIRLYKGITEKVQLVEGKIEELDLTPYLNWEIEFAGGRVDLDSLKIFLQEPKQ